MKPISKTFRVGLLLSCLAAASAVQAASVVDNFNTSRNYLTDGLAGTIWDGVYLGAGEFANTGRGDNPGTTLTLNANITSNAMLTVQTKATDWEAQNDDGFFLYKTVSGDFQAVVHVVPPFDATAYNCAGLMARAAGAGGAPFGGSENYVAWFRFDEYGFGNYGRNTHSAISDNLNPGDGVKADTYWIMLERVGTLFNTYYSTFGPDDPSFFGWQPTSNCNFDRPDLAGQPVQVGIMQATFSDNTPTVYFEKFSLTNANLGLTPPAPATGFTMTATADGALTLNWTAGAGSAGSVVVMRRDGLLMRQPSLGTTYTGNATFGLGDMLGKDTYIVYAGTGNSVTVQPTPGTYTAAVYSYSGTGATTTYALANVPTATATVVPVLSSITLTAPTSLVLYGGAQATVNAVYANGAVVDVTAQATYSSSASSILQVSTTGFVTANGHGTASITATFQGKSDTKSVTVGDPEAATLIHRYSFTEAPGTLTVADSVGTANGTVYNLGGAGSDFDGTGQFILNNTGSGTGGNVNYIELPPDLMTNLQSVSFETWVTDQGTGIWGRIMDFGASYGGAGTSSGGSNYIFMGVTAGALRSAYGYDPGEIYFEAAKPALNKKTHIVLTMYAPAKLGLMYIDGKLAGTFQNMVIPGTTNAATPAALGPTPNDWLGRSQYNDNGYNGAYDEFRMYNGSLSALQILVNSVAGPNQVVTPGDLQSLTLTVETTNMKKLGTQQATVTANFANISNIPLTTFPDTTYTSSDPTIVAVDATGKLTSFDKLGTATITASYGGMNSSTAVTVVPFVSTGYARNMQISFDGYAQSETLTNFPALVTLNSSISGFAYSQFLSTDAADLRFTDSEGTELNYEIEKWDTAGTSYVWVQVPRLAKGTQITAYWGKAGLTVPDYRTSGATWSDGFTGVWHMQTNWVADASGHGFNANAIVAEGAVTETPGVIGSAQNYDAATGNGATSVGNVKPGSRATFSAWVWLAEQNREGIFMAKDGNVFFWQQGTNLRHELSPWGGDTMIGISAAGGAAPSQGNWFHIAGTVEGADLTSTVQKIYINGQLRGTWSKRVDAINDNQWVLGGISWGRIMNGKLDECRVDSVTRSPAWIWACWKNQSAPTQFGTYSAAYQTTAPLAVVLPQATLSGSSAVLGGRVVSDGGTGVTSWGTVWGTTAAPTDNSLATSGTANAPFSFTQSRSGFTPGTHYYFRAWASNAVSGKVYSPDGEFVTEPVSAASVAFSGIYNNQMTVSWTASPGAAGYLVVMKAASDVTVAPADGVTYTANSIFGLGQDIGGSSYAVYNGTGTSVTVKNLARSTTYYVAVYAYAGSAGLTSYADPAKGNQVTPDTAVTTYPNVIKASNPIAFWPLYETTGTVANELIASRNGTYSGNAALGAPGPQPGSLAVLLSGGKVSSPYAVAVNPTGSFTAEAWIRPDNTGAGSRTIVQQMVNGENTANGNDRSGWCFRQNGDALTFLVGSANLYTTTATTPAGALTAGVWQHVVATYDSTTLAITFYVNGAQVYTQTAAVAIEINTLAPTIIGDRGYGGWTFAGSVADVAIYDRLLSLTEIQKHYTDQGLPATLSIAQQTNGQLKIEWSTGTLVECDTPNGTYTAVSGATSPYTVTPTAAQKFYRLKLQ